MTAFRSSYKETPEHTKFRGHPLVVKMFPVLFLIRIKKSRTRDVNLKVMQSSVILEYVVVGLWKWIYSPP